MRRVILVALIISICPTTKAMVEIDDFFSHHIEFVDRIYARYSFEEAFKCGDQATFQSAKNMCEVICRPFGSFGNACQSYCIPPDLRSEMVTQTIVNCDGNQATIFSSDGDIRTVTKADFLRYKKNPLREIIQQLPNWIPGVHKISFLTRTAVKHTLGWKTPSERQVNAWQFEATVSANAGSGINDEQYIFTIIDDPSIPWFAQIARVRIMSEGTLWRLHDL